MILLLRLWYQQIGNHRFCRFYSMHLYFVHGILFFFRTTTLLLIGWDSFNQMLDSWIHFLKFFQLFVLCTISKIFPIQSYFFIYLIDSGIWFLYSMVIRWFAIAFFQRSIFFITTYFEILILKFFQFFIP